MGTLGDRQKEDWKSHVHALVHAYNSTRHDTTGYSPFFLMFGRHPRLPLDIAMGLQLEKDPAMPTQKYVEELRDRLETAYGIATGKTQTAGGLGKDRYDKAVRGATVQLGDRVLVKNVGLRGKCKLANRFEANIYRVMEQPDLTIPVFVVVNERDRRKRRTLHRNMLLPVNFLSPASKEIPQIGPPLQTPAAPDVIHQRSLDLSSDESVEEEEHLVWLGPEQTLAEHADPLIPQQSPQQQREQQQRESPDRVGNALPQQSPQQQRGQQQWESPDRVGNALPQLSPRPQRQKKPPDRYQSVDFRKPE